MPAWQSRGKPHDTTLQKATHWKGAYEGASKLWTLARGTSSRRACDAPHSRQVANQDDHR
jgi:hypothetical protein